LDGIRSWEIASGKPRGAFATPPQHLWVAFSPNGKTVASAGLRDFVCLWDLMTGKEIRQFPGQRYVVSLGFLPDGKLVTAGDGVRLTDVAEGTMKVVIDKVGTSAVALSADGKQMLASFGNTGIALWDVETGKPLWQAKVPLVSFPTLAFSADGKAVAATGYSDRESDLNNPEKCVHLYATAQGKKIAQFGKGAGYFRTVALSPDGRTVVAGGDDGRIHIWERETAQERHVLIGHRGSVNVVIFARDHNTLISASDDGTALVWSVAVQSPPRELTAADLDAAWAGLARDAGKAYDAWGSLAAAPKLATQFLAKKLQPEKAISAERLAPLLAALGSEQLTERDKAAKQLEGLGDLAGAELRKAIAGNLPLEHKRRIELLLAKLPAPLNVEQLRSLRAVEVLEHLGRPMAQQILTKLANGAPAARLTQESRAALDRLAKKAKTP
jgi:sugar lactone lactonase YvrE